MYVKCNKLIETVIHAVILACMTSCFHESKTVTYLISEDLSESNSVTLVKDGFIKVTPEDPLLLRTIWDPIRMSYDGNILMLLNFEDHHIILTDTDGEVITGFGETGSGPEELRSIYTLGFDESNRVIVFDHNQDLFKIFDVNGQFSASIPGMLKDNLWNRGKRLFGYDGKIYTAVQEASKAGYGDSESALISEYSNEGSLIRLISVYDESLKHGNKFYISPVIHLNRSAEIFYTGHRTWPIIRAIDRLSGTEIIRFGFTTARFSEPESEVQLQDSPNVRAAKRLDQTALSKIYSCDDYVYVHFFNLNEFFSITQDPNDKEHFLYLFDKSENYAFAGEIVLPYALGGIDYDGTMYLIEDDDPDNFTLGIYRLKANPQAD